MKKTFKALLCGSFILASFSALANYTATEALERILLPKTYFGEDCAMEVTKDLGVATITGRNGERDITVEIDESLHYRWQPGVRYFLSGKKPFIFMTRAVTENTQYMVVAEKREEGEVAVECVVNL